MPSAKTRKVVWPDIVARAAEISGGRRIEAVKKLLQEREKERMQGISPEVRSR
jgi:hypothetical protein